MHFPNELYKDNPYYVPQIESMDMDTLYITHVHTTIPEADAFFPVIEEEYWEKVSVSETHFDEATGYEFEFVVYKKRQA